MDARKFDVLEHAADYARGAVAQTIDVQFDRVLQKLVNEDRLAGHHVEHLADNPLQFLGAVDDEHAAAAQDEGWAKQHRIADFLSKRIRLALSERRPVGRLPESQFVEDGRKQLPVLGDLNAFGGSPYDVHAVRLQGGSEVQGGLPPELHDRPKALLLPVDLEDVLERERLEIEPVARVVVGRHGFRV